MRTPAPAASRPAPQPETGLRRPLCWALGLSTTLTALVTALVIATIAVALHGAAWLLGSFVEEIPQAWLDAPGDWWRSVWLTTLLITVGLAAIVAVTATVGVRLYRPARRWRPGLQGLAATGLVALTSPLWWTPVPTLFEGVAGTAEREATERVKDYVDEHGAEHLRDGQKWLREQSGRAGR